MRNDTLKTLYPRKQLLSSPACLSCKLCCRFQSSHSPWEPHLLAEEKANNCLSDLRLVADIPTGYVCSKLLLPAHTCAWYRERPLECRLYPFLVQREGRKLLLAAHLACPFVQDHCAHDNFKLYAAYLCRHFRKPQAARLLANHFDSFVTYPDEEIIRIDTLIPVQ